MRPVAYALAVLALAAGLARAAEPLGPAGVPAADFPAPDRPVAEIISPIWAGAAERDAADETGQIVSRLSIGPGTAVADLGAGSGFHALRLARVVGPSGRVYAEDVQPDYLAALETTVAREKLANVTVVRGEPSDPRLAPGSVDVAILVHMYHEIPQPYGLLYNLVPALRPGARVGILDLDARPEDHGTPPALLRCEVEAVGYRQVEARPLTGIAGYLAVFEPPLVAQRPEPRAIKACGLVRR